MDDIYTAKLDGTEVANLTRSPGTWEEHGKYSPAGQYFAFMSSRHDRSLRFPRARAAQLVTELYIREGNKEPVQVTRVNTSKDQKTVVSDFDWDQSGKRIVFQVAKLDNSELPKLMILTLP